jgi:transcriptional regulator with XRE-family HTH domain
MAKKPIILLPRHERLLAELGENLRLARLRRRLSAEQVAERADISRSTLHLMETGAAGTSLGKLLQVLVVLGLEADITRLAADDALGRKLEDARLTESRRRAPKRTGGKDKRA